MSFRQSSSTPSVRIELLRTRRTTGTLRASRGSCRVNLISTARPPRRKRYPDWRPGLTPLDHPDREVLDHRVGQQGRRDLLDRPGGVVAAHLDLEVLPLPHRRHGLEPEAR